MNAGRTTQRDLLDKYASFWLFDHRERAAALSSITLTGATLGFVLNSLLGVSLGHSVIAVIIVGLVSALIIPTIRLELPVRFMEPSSIRMRAKTRTFACAFSITVLFLGNIPASLLQAAIVDRRLKDAARGKITSQQLASTLSIASESHIPRLNRALLESVTTKIVYASGTQPQVRDKWDLLMSAVNLASSLEPTPKLPSVSSGFEWDSAFAAPESISGKPRLILFGSTEDREVQAHYQKLGVSLNEERAIGPQYIEVVGGVIGLDGSDISRVIFNGVQVEYRGTRTKLHEVRFVNCTFRIEPVLVLSSPSLIRKILLGGSISFS